MCVIGTHTGLIAKGIVGGHHLARHGRIDIGGGFY
jgi:hypothetical protein